MEQFEGKTGAFYFLFEKRSHKTFKEEGFRKCLESKSVLSFLLRCIYRTFAVFRRNKAVLRCAVVNACLFVRLFYMFICNLFLFFLPLNEGIDEQHWWIFFYQRKISSTTVHCVYGTIMNLLGNETWFRVHIIQVLWYKYLSNLTALKRIFLLNPLNVKDPLSDRLRTRIVYKIFLCKL